MGDEPEPKADDVAPLDFASQKPPTYRAATHRTILERYGLWPKFKADVDLMWKTKGYTRRRASEETWTKLWPLIREKQPKKRKYKLSAPAKLRQRLMGKVATYAENAQWAIDAIGMEIAGVPVDMDTAPSWAAIVFYELAREDKNKLLGPYIRKMVDGGHVGAVGSSRDDGGKLGVLDELCSRYTDEIPKRYEDEPAVSEGPEDPCPDEPGAPEGSLADV